MATKYNTIVKSVTAIQFSFDVLKELYMFLNYKDVTYQITNRVISGIITMSDDTKRRVEKHDYVVKYSDGTVEIYKPEEFKKLFVEASSTTTGA